MTQQDEGSLRSQASGGVFGSLRQRLAAELDNAYEGIDPEVSSRTQAAVDAVLAVVTPELERRDAEIERLRLNHANLDKAAGSWWGASQRNAEGWREANAERDTLAWLHAEAVWQRDAVAVNLGLPKGTSPDWVARWAANTIKIVRVQKTELDALRAQLDRLEGESREWEDRADTAEGTCRSYQADLGACSCSPKLVWLHESGSYCGDPQYEAIHELLDGALITANLAGEDGRPYGAASHAGDLVLKLLDVLRGREEPKLEVPVTEVKLDGLVPDKNLERLRAILLPGLPAVAVRSGVDLPEVEAAPQEAIDAALFAVALDRVRRDKGARHTLEDVVREIDALDDPSPEASSGASTNRQITNEINTVGSTSTPPAAGEADTTPPRDKTCGATEGMTGLACDLHPGHQDWHSGKWEPKPDTDDYPIHAQWPRNKWDTCTPPSNSFREGDREPDQNVREVRGKHSGRTYTRRLEGFGGPWDYETGDGAAWTGWEALLRLEWSVEVLPNTEQEAEK